MGAAPPPVGALRHQQFYLEKRQAERQKQLTELRARTHFLLKRQKCALMVSTPRRDPHAGDGQGKNTRTWNAGGMITGI